MHDEPGLALEREVEVAFDLPAPDPMPHRRDNVAAARVESEDVLDRPVALQVLALDRAGARYKGNAPINFGCRTASLLV